MHMHRRSTIAVLSLPLATLAAVLLACSSSKGPSQLQVNLVDAPNPDVDQIVVNITQVTAHSTSGGWMTIGPMVSPTSVNLLDLQASAMPLGLVNLPAGKITQVRLFVAPDGDYVVPVGTTTHQPLVVPSGVQSGIKILGPWDVPTCSKLSITLDFDGKNSIEYHQADGTWILRPVIRAKDQQTTALACQAEPPAPPPVCSLEAPCPEGQVCTSGACVAATPLASGSACTNPAQCITGLCNEGLCAPGDGGAGCLSNADCVSQSCAAATCQSAGTIPVGQACTVNAQCLTQTCDGLWCMPGLQGAPCQTARDCAALNCSAGFCGPPILGPPPGPGPAPM